ncbi:MAG: hypothetical protein QM778_07955 [Myxococcales bacterium]
MTAEPEVGGRRGPLRLLRWSWQGLAVLALLLSVIVARSLLSARAEWEGGQRALAEGKASLAITFFRRSASWHVPLSPYTGRSLEMLEHLSRREAQRGRNEAARVALRGQTSAQNASRGFGSPLAGDPSPLFSLLALGGWLCWSLASFALVTRGLDGSGQVTPLAARCVLVIVVGMVVFALGLALA